MKFFVINPEKLEYYDCLLQLLLSLLLL